MLLSVRSSPNFSVHSVTIHSHARGKKPMIWESDVGFGVMDFMAADLYSCKSGERSSGRRRLVHRRVHGGRR